MRLAPQVTGIVAAGLIAASTAATTGADHARPPRQDAAACRDRGPTPGVPMTSAERAAFPDATRGRVFISIRNRRVMMLDLATGRRTRLAAGIRGPHEVAVSPDGRWGVAADFGQYTGDYNFDSHQLAIFDLRAGRLVRVIDLLPYRGPHDLFFLDTTRVLVTLQTSRLVAEVDVTTGRVLGVTPTGAHGSHTMALTPDGATAFTANQPEGSLSRLDLRRRALVWVDTIAAGRQTEGVATTPDGRLVLMGFEDPGEVLLLHGETGAVLERFGGFGVPNRMTMTPDGRYALVTDFRCEVVQVVDVANRRVLGPIAGLAGAGVARVLPDNRTALVVLLDEKEIAMVDVVGRRVIARYEIGGLFSLDGAAWGPP